MATPEEIQAEKDRLRKSSTRLTYNDDKASPTQRAAPPREETARPSTTPEEDAARIKAAKLEYPYLREGSTEVGPGETVVARDRFTNVPLVTYGGEDGGPRETALKALELHASKLTNARLTALDASNRTGFKGAVMNRADISNGNFSGSNLTMTKLREADARGVNFKGARLIGADLRGMQVDSRTSFEGANVGNADLRGMPGLTREMLKGAIGLSSAILDDADFEARQEEHKARLKRGRMANNEP